MQQSDLFEPLLAAYRNVQIHDEGISDAALCKALNLVGGERKPVGRAQEKETEYVDFICGALEPLLKNLIVGGCIALNVSNDIFLSKSSPLDVRRAAHARAAARPPGPAAS